MSKPTFSLLSLSLATLLLATGCAGTMKEKDSSSATVSAAPAETSASSVASTDAATTNTTMPATDAASADAMTPEAGTSMKSPSKLLMANEVAGLTGRRVMAMPGNGNVRYVEKMPAGDTATVATVSYAPATTFDDTKNASASQRLKVSPVMGLGQGAFYDATNNMLYVKGSDQTLVVGVPANIAGKDRRNVAIQMARLAVARM